VAGINAADPDSDYLLVKYGADGGERWRFTLPTGGGANDGGVALRLDESRRIIVAANAVSGGLPSAIMVSQFSQAPLAPSGVTAIAGNGLVSVSFQPPPPSGDSPVSTYTVNCSPGGIPTSGSASPIVVTGLTNGVGYSCTVTASNAFGTGPPSTAVLVLPNAGAPLVLLSAVSRKQHGTVGTFEIPITLNLPVGGAVTVEPRAAGLGHSIAFRFNNTATLPASVTVTDAMGAAIGGTPLVSASGFELLVTVPGIADRQRTTITLNGIGASTVSVTMGFLLGDVSNSGVVTASDLSTLKVRRGLQANVINFRADLDVSGTIDAADLSAARASAGASLP